ncbi:DUF397 domain-containing protein [Klebsiella pneumoniae]|nr:DUF397 domain-containing protein [Klebsiella pneumoniae]
MLGEHLAQRGQRGGLRRVADLPAGAAVRDSKHPEAGHLAFPASEWPAFLADARRGRL